MRAWLLPIVIAILPGQASAALPHCYAKVVKNVYAMDNPGAMMRAGADWGQITQLRVYKKSGEAFYCAHGDYCYSVDAIEIVSPCRFVRAEHQAAEDEEYFFDIK